MKILITGGAGCLGSNLIEHWLPDGHELFVIDNFVTGKPDLLSGLRGLSLCEGTIADAKLVKQCFADFRPEVVVHAAASYKDLMTGKKITPQTFLAASMLPEPRLNLRAGVSSIFRQLFALVARKRPRSPTITHWHHSVATALPKRRASSSCY